MQLIIFSITLFFIVLTQDVKAQVRKMTNGSQPNSSNRDSVEVKMTEYVRPDWKAIDMDFLSSYYSQDGNNGAVTGGIGTEQLTDFTQKVSIRVPMTPTFSLNVDGGYDYYSSASTDNIDNIRSSDSASDMRTHANIGASFDLSDTKMVGFRFGGSTEYDYTSISGGVNAALFSRDQNTSLQLNLQAFIDKWDVIFPVELRRTARVATHRRNSYNASIGFSQIVSKRTQVQIQIEGTYMNGLLSTPFHRVYFQEQNRAQIELLPDTRTKIPIGFRLNSHLTENLILRSYYRYYWDSWGMQGHTAQIELPIKLNRFLSIAPYYRYHTQTAVDYFRPYKEHTLDEQFYTSDFDLSALQSHAYGVAVSYSPAGGLIKAKIPFSNRPAFTIKSIDVKYSHYDRSTGLKADIISLGVGISF